MLRSMLASKTTKLVAACVCPVAGTGALTVAVPQVRSAVHKATAPRAYAAPKARVRPASVAPCPDATPVIVNSPLALVTPQPPASTQITTQPPTQLASSRDRNPQVPTDVGRPGRPGIAPGVPEVTTWVQMIVGFGLVGGAVRLGSQRTGIEQA